ncbi:MAG TPA: hypothetical protein PKI68_03815, partial [Pontiellaceae bacterium]|nr:hypothetical protein [Pontiellaceae bacterium]
EAAGLIAAIDRKDLQWINVHLMALRCVLLSRALLRPVELVQALFAWVRNEWVESIMPYPITPIVLLTGNKELIDYAAQTLSKRFEERFVFTSVKIQEGAKGHSIRFLWKRRVRSSRLGLTLVLYDVALPTQASLFRLISPVNLVLNVKSTDPDSILGYERQIIQCFAKMNASKDQF